jgi:hypothetical protein
MSDEEKKRKYIEEVFKYCKIDSILVINKHGHLQRLDCPFEVIVISDVKFFSWFISKVLFKAKKSANCTSRSS